MPPRSDLTADGGGEPTRVRWAALRRRAGLRALVLAVAVAMAYGAGSMIVFGWFDAKGLGPTFFPAAGLTLALLLLVDRRDWPAVLVGVASAELASDLAHGFTVPAAIGFALANVAEPLTGAWLLRRRIGPVDLSRRRDTVAFLIIGVGIAPLAGATVAAATTALTSGLDDPLRYVAHWWLGDGLGILIVGTAILGFVSSRDALPVDRRRQIESALLVAATAATSIYVFWAHALSFAYLPAALLILTALRAGAAAAALGAAVMAFVAAQAAATVGASWARFGVTQSTVLLYLQLWIMVVTITAFLLAAEVSERGRTTIGLARAEGLRRVARRLSMVVTPDECAMIIADEAMAGLNAASVGVILRDRGGAFRVIGGTGAVEQHARDEPHLPAQGETVSAHAIRSRAASFAADLRELAEHYPGSVAVARSLDVSAVAALPLFEDDQVIGVLSIAFAVPTPFDASARAFMDLLARDCEQALSRARLFSAERLARQRADDRRRLAEAMLVASTLDGVVRAGAAELRRAFDAGWASVMVRDPDGRPVTSMDGDRPDPLAERQFHALIERVRRTEQADLTAVAAALPLRDATGCCGAVVLSFVSRQSFDPDTVAYLEALVDDVEQALERARLEEAERRARTQLYERERHVSLQLQQSLLGSPYPDIEGLTLASYYGAADEGLQAGGDWHNVVSLPDGRAAFAAGDVLGHGLRAAVAMGQLRIALAAIATSGVTPSELLGRLDDFATNIDGAEMATVTYVLLDPGEGILRYACAGHPPPLIIEPDQQPRFLRDGRSSPLQASLRTRRVDGEIAVVAGTVLILYTDGLVERRGEPITEGFDRLREHAAGLAGAGMPELCQGLVDAMLGGQTRSDDVAVLAVRIDSIERERFTRRIPNRPEQLAPLRRELTAWLTLRGVSSNDRTDILIAVSEAAANAIEHAYQGPGEVLINVRLTPTGEVVATIEDHGRWRPPVENADRGRGRRIMESLMDVRIASDEHGSRVQLRRPRPVPVGDPT